MIKAVYRVETDLTASAGQMLVVREDGTLHVVSRDAIEQVFKPVEVAAPVVEEPASLSKSERKEVLKAALMRGESLRQAAKAAEMSISTAFKIRQAMIAEGVMREIEAGVHGWYRDPEALERARERGRRLAEARARSRKMAQLQAAPSFN